MARRREVSGFNLSFLDIMFCGFGAVVLLVVLLYGQVIAERIQTHQDLRSEVLAQQRQIAVKEQRLEQRQSALESTESRLEAARQEAAAARQRISELETQLQQGPDPEAAARRVAAMEEEVNRLQERVEELREEAADASGQQVAQFAGEGRRQYLSGLKLGGERILILLDASASMLDREILDVIRLRNMPAERRRDAAKWQHAVSSTRWLIANLPPESRFQIYLFNEETRALLEDTQGQWLEARDSERIEAIQDRLSEATPEKGTSLINAFSAAQSLSPAPDNILLLTDGLPTMGSSPPRRSTVSGDQRLSLYDRAVQRLGTGIPVNTLLFPMEGDPVAAAAYWHLATRTRGSFITPAEDWP